MTIPCDLSMLEANVQSLKGISIKVILDHSHQYSTQPSTQVAGNVVPVIADMSPQAEQCKRRRGHVQENVINLIEPFVPILSKKKIMSVQQLCH